MGSPYSAATLAIGLFGCWSSWRSRRDRLAGALVEHAGRQRLHGDAVLDRADIDAEIAADALVVHHLEVALAVDLLGDRLVRGVLAGDVAAAALDAELLVDARLGDVVEVEDTASR